MKKLILFDVFALFIAAFSVACKKNTEVDNSPRVETFDGDEYDKGLVIEEPEDVEEAEVPDYNSEAIKIDSITGYKWSDNMPVNEDCTTEYKYKNNLIVNAGTSNKMTLYTSDKDSIISISSNKTTLNPLLSTQNILSKVHQFSLSTTNDLFKIGTVKITITGSSGKTYSKSIKVIGANSNDDVYGTSNWGFRDERVKIEKSSDVNISDNSIDITSSYTPQRGDVLIFGNKSGVITTAPTFKAATSTKPSAYKFKAVEMNAKCNNRKTTKSITMTDPTQIKSADGATYATKYFRD